VLSVPRSTAERLYWTQLQLRGRGDVRERLAWLRSNETCSPEEIDTLQATKLRELVAHAVSTVPYYARVFAERGLDPDSIREPADLTRLPLLTRSVLAANKEALISNMVDRESLQTNHSSGSTGQRAEFHQDLDFRLWMRAHQLRTYSWCNDWQVGERFVLLWGSEIYWNLRQPIERFENRLSNRREFNTFHLSPELVQRFAAELARFEPVLVSSYSNALHLVVRELERHPRKLPGLRAVQATSEPFPPELRQRIMDVLGCGVYDKYGMRETNIVSHEAPDHSGMMVQSENVVVEILDDDDQLCPVGKSGRVVVTSLNNHAMPLIRYETSDVAALLPRSPHAVLPFPVMSPVAGRLQDLITVPGAGHVDSYFFSYLLMQKPEIQWFQVVQEVPDELLLRLYTPDGFSARLHAELVERIRHHTGFNYQINIETLSEMPTSSTGKFRLCISHVPS
jgi:phenylacetate-CoA ligase